MRYSDPVGYLITWTCYGTWLHGDERGSVDHSLAAHGWPKVVADPVIVQTMQRKLTQQPYLMDASARGIVDATVREVCAHRKWTLAALNVRTNHVHAVTWALCSPEKILGDLKAWCTRRLRERGVIAKDRKVWTEGGSTRYLWTPDDNDKAISYVRDQQGAMLDME